MTATDTLHAVAAIQATDHAYLGIRPADATPTEAPAVVISTRDPKGLAYALQEARERWPECPRWALIGSDQLLHLIDPTWPPELREFRAPSQLATFPA
jgi:hypothetical protein